MELQVELQPCFGFGYQSALFMGKVEIFAEDAASDRVEEASLFAHTRACARS